MPTHFKLLAVLLCYANGLAAQTITGNIQHDGLSRAYRLHLPPGLPAGSHPPLVFNLHGYSSNAMQQEAYSGMNAVADTANFLVCYPDGINNAWNIGTAGGSTADDVGFIAAMIDSFHAQYGIDLERVYSCGMSNGGFFSYRLACEMGGRIAAIASVTGSMTTELLNNCSPDRPVPVLEIHGNADPVVDFDGSTGIASIPDVIAGWAGENGCVGPIGSGSFPDIVTNDQATASFDIHTGCEGGAEVILITIQNGGHTWPGAFPTVVFGATCQDFNASSEIWNFFNRFHLEMASAADGTASQTQPLAVFPNPFHDELHITGSELVRAFNAQGQPIWTGSTSQPMDTSAWPPGVYFLWVRNGGRLVGKMVTKG